MEHFVTRLADEGHAGDHTSHPWRRREDDEEWKYGRAWASKASCDSHSLPRVLCIERRHLIPQNFENTQENYMAFFFSKIAVNMKGLLNLE